MADIGSVSVRVVPSAKNFLPELKAQILPGMDKLGEEAGLLFKDGFEGRPIHVEVDADTTKAKAQIAELQRAANSNSGGALLPAILGLGPALIPIAAAATAAGGAFVLMGASGILAVQGIKKEMQQGTAIGNDYATGLDKLKSDLGTLEKTAAKGFLAPFNDAVAKATVLLPDLNREVGTFSSLAGRAATNLLTGLIAGFHTMEPLITLIGDDLVHLTGSFSSFAAGGGLTKFAAYAQSVLPQVEETLKAVAQAILAITAAAGPLGGAGLTAIKALADGINAIPVDVLKVLVPLATAGYLAFRAYSALAPIFATTTVAMTGFNEAMAVQAALASADGIAVGKLGLAMATVRTGALGMGAALGVATIAVTAILVANNALSSHFRTTAADANTAAQAYTALGRAGQLSSDQLKSFGVASGNLGSVIENAFHESTLTKIKDFQFGLNNIIHTPFNSATDDMKNFFKSTDAGLTQLASNGSIVAAKSALQDLAAQTGVSVDKLLTKLPDLKKFLDALAAPPQVVKLNGVVQATTDSLALLAKHYGITAAQAQSYATIVGITSDEVKNSTVSQAALATAVASVGSAYNNGNQALQTYLGALSTFSQSAGTAADRATLIGATLVNANGDALSYGTAINQAAVANKGFSDAVKQAATDAKESTGQYLASVIDLKSGTIDYTNAAAAPLIQSLDSIQSAAMNAASATYLHQKSIEGGTKAADDAYTVYQTQTRTSLLDQAKQLGLTSIQAQTLADKYFGIPADVKTKIEQQGADPVVTILSSINTWLHRIADPAWAAKVDADTAAAHVKLAATQAALTALGIPVTATILANTTQANLAIAQTKAQLLALDGATATTYLNTVTSVNKQNSGSSGTGIGKATGGLIQGPGTGTSDTAGLFALSNREFVSTAQSVSKNFAALAAGNRGAQLKVDDGLAAGGIPMKRSLTNASATEAQFGGSVGATIIVNPSPGMDEESLALAVSRRWSARAS